MNKEYISEELRDLTNTGNINSYGKTTIFMIFFLILSLLLSIYISYPEVISGRVSISASNQINKIYSPNDGEIRVLVKEDDIVLKGNLIGIIESSTSYSDLQTLKRAIDKINFEDINTYSLNSNILKDLNLGNLQNDYYDFLGALFELDNFRKIDIASEKIRNLKNKKERNIQKLEVEKLNENILTEKVQITEDKLAKDNFLLSKKAIVENDKNRSKIEMFSATESLISSEKAQLEIENNNKDLAEEISLLSKERMDENLKLLFNVKRSLLKLKSSISIWEYKHLIKTPISGSIEFYEPSLSTGQFIKKDMPIFLVLPKIDKLKATGIFSSDGYGKINLSDTVNITLKDFPYKEYGYIKGIVQKKSKVYQDSIYYIDVKLFDGLNTTYGKSVDFAYNMTGEIEFVTEKSSILERIFRNLKKTRN